MTATTAALVRTGSLLGRLGQRSVLGMGDLSVFAGQILLWLMARPCQGTWIPVFYSVGVRSVPVIAITGMFLGMLLAVQSYVEFNHIGMANHLGALINISVVREMGPVLAATMLAGRVGSAMAAELATMRVTEQVDALSCLGVNPIHYLVVPRVMACVLLTPVLTILADFMGVGGGALVCTKVYHIDAHYYWLYAQGFVGMWDMTAGLVKPMIFGTALGLISCHRGFRSSGGAEGVGQAATEAFVYSFLAILLLDYFIVMFLNTLYVFLWPDSWAMPF